LINKSGKGGLNMNQNSKLDLAQKWLQKFALETPQYLELLKFDAKSALAAVNQSATEEAIAKYLIDTLMRKDLIPLKDNLEPMIITMEDQHTEYDPEDTAETTDPEEEVDDDPDLENEEEEEDDDHEISDIFMDDEGEDESEIENDELLDLVSLSGLDKYFFPK